MDRLKIAYHVVTERPMQAGQILRFDQDMLTGVARRVNEKAGAIEQIYAHPDRFVAEQLEHHTRVALRELALEEVRRSRYPQYPSRLNCLYVSETLDEAEVWANSFVRWGRPTYHIVKVSLTGRVFTGDAHNCFEAATNLAQNISLAERYWRNLPNEYGKPPVRETLADGQIEVLEIVREIRKNL